MAIIIASRIKLNLQQLLRKKIVMCVAVRIKMAIIIASRIKLNLQQLLRKKIVMCVAVRIKMDFAAVAKEKTAYS